MSAADVKIKHSTKARFARSRYDQAVKQGFKTLAAKIKQEVDYHEDIVASACVALMRRRGEI